MKKPYTIYKNDKLGKKDIIEPFSFVGKPPKGKKNGELKLLLGDNSIIRSNSVIYSGSIIGKGLVTGTGVVIREDNIIKDNVSIGTLSILEIGNKIGKNVRIHSGCFMEMAEIEDDVFIGPCVVLTDDPHPPCKYYKKCVGGVKIARGVSIGANSTILPGVRIGKFSVIGAGSVVVDDIPEAVVAVGNPAKVIKRVAELKCTKGFLKRPYEWQIKTR